MSEDPDLLITRYLDGQADADEVHQLDQAIRRDAALRQRFVAQASLMGLLGEGLRGGAVALPAAAAPAVVRSAGPSRHPVAGPRSVARPWPRRASLVAGVLALVVAVWWATRPAAVAVVASGAQLIAWDGAATVRRGEVAQPLTTGMVLGVGDRLDAGVDGRLDLVWPDGSRTGITAASLAVLTAPAAAPVLTLERGRVEVEVINHRSAPPLAIVVGDWRIVHLGTVFSVSTGDGPRVQVRDGSVAIHSTNAPATPTLTVRAGQAAAPDVAGRPRLQWDLPVLTYATAAHPFAANSPWNTPIPLGTARTAFSAAALTTVPWTTTASRILIVTGVEPRIEVVLGAPGRPLGRVPSVPGLEAARVAATDFLVVLDPDGRRVWELYEARLGEQRVTAQRMEAVELGSAGTTGIILPAGYPAYAGLVQGDELRTGIHHALALFMTESMLSAAGVRLGDRLALPEEFVVPTGAPAVAPEVVSALRRHGAIVVGVALKPQVGVDSRLPVEVHAQVAASLERLVPYLQRVR